MSRVVLLSEFSPVIVQSQGDVILEVIEVFHGVLQLIDNERGEREIDNRLREKRGRPSRLKERVLGNKGLSFEW